MQGNHNVSHGERNKLFVTSAQNVAFECEFPDLCQIGLGPYGDIIIENSNQVALSHLNLATDVNIRNTSNVTISKVNTSQYRVRVLNPTGYLNIESSYIKLTTDILYCPFPSRNELCWLNMHLRNVTSKWLSLMVHSSRYPNNTNGYNTVDVLFDNITVIRISSKWTLQVGTYPNRSCNITVTNSIIAESSSLSLTVDYNVFKEPDEVVVNIIKCHFLESAFQYYENTLYMKVGILPQITLRDLLFDGGAVNANGKLKITDPTATPKQCLRKTTIHFHNCSFTGLSLSKRKVKRYVIQLKNLLFPFLLSNCDIVNNSAPAIDIENSVLYLRGQNRIEGNVFDNIGKVTEYGDGSIRIRYSGTSHVFIEETSQLIIGNNRGYYHGGIVFHPIPYKNSTYEEYIQCIRDEKKGCDGDCFFQLVNEKGRLINDDQLNHFNGSIIFYNNTAKNASVGGHQIFNGHLLNCTLQLVNNRIRTNFSLLHQSIHISYNMNTYSSWQPKDVTSLPYYICLCDDSQPMNSSLWDCGQNTTLSHYPGQSIALNVSLVGDFDQSKNGSLYVYSKHQDKSDVQVFVGTCSALSLDYLTSGGILSKTDVILPWGYRVKDLFLTHKINVNVIQCPIGFQDVNGSKCECNEFLKWKHFKCYIDDRSIVYRQKKKYYWIGLNENKLMISNNCPSFFCNNILQDTGVTLDDIKSNSKVQCKDNRVGLMCSECRSGYSSVIGTKRTSIMIFLFVSSIRTYIEELYF